MVGESVAARERCGLRAGEQNAVGRFHDTARDQHRVAHAADAGHAARGQRLARHHARVEFGLALGVEDRAGAGVEQGVVLERDDGGRDRLEGAASGREDCPACLAGRAHARDRRITLVHRPVAGATVYRDDRHAAIVQRLRRSRYWI